MAPSSPPGRVAAIPCRESRIRIGRTRLVGMSYQLTDIELKQLIDRYVAQWNEPDPDRRRRRQRREQPPVHPHRHPAVRGSLHPR
jgi:hypothetical protein